MIERAIADGCRLGWCCRQRVWRQLRVSPARALRGSGLRRRLTPYDHGVAAWICWDAESVTPWRSVIWPTPSGEVAFGG